jgi:hypothetical protein
LLLLVMLLLVMMQLLLLLLGVLLLVMVVSMCLSVRRPCVRLHDAFYGLTCPQWSIDHRINC